MDRFCPACGTQRADGSNFCSKCGHGFEPAAPAAAVAAAASPAPAPAPAAAAPAPPAATPAPQPAAGAPPPYAGQAAPAPPPPGRAPIPRAVFIIIGLLGIGLGVWKILDAFHVFSPRHSSSSTYSGSTPAPSFPSSTSSASLSGSGIDEAWLVGTWTPASGTRCATWVRFNSDHTLTDEHGISGSWSLYTAGVTTGDLTMTVSGRPTVHGNASRLEQDLLSLGRQYWRRAAC